MRLTSLRKFKKMPKKSKRYLAVKEKIAPDRAYALTEAIKLLKETSTVKFDASVEIHANLGIDPKKGEQIVRSTVSLPHGTGKTKRIAAFVTSEKEKEAKASGADVVGGLELINQIKASGKCDFDIAVAEPAIMKDLAVIAKILGTKGLMPNPKTGTVTPDIKKAVAELKKGKIAFKNDDSANVHVLVGKVSFSDDQLKENIEAFINTLKRLKPETVKGTYIRSLTLSSSMGPGIKIQS